MLRYDIAFFVGSDEQPGSLNHPVISQITGKRFSGFLLKDRRKIGIGYPQHLTDLIQRKILVTVIAADILLRLRDKGLIGPASRADQPLPESQTNSAQPAAQFFRLHVQKTDINILQISGKFLQLNVIVSCEPV